MAVRRLLEELFPTAEFSVELVGDNAAANMIANGQASIRKVRHLTLQQLYIRELTQGGFLVVRYKPSGELSADMLTKVLGEQKLSTLLTQVGFVA